VTSERGFFKGANDPVTLAQRLDKARAAFKDRTSSAAPSPTAAKTTTAAPESKAAPVPAPAAAAAAAEVSDADRAKAEQFKTLANQLQSQVSVMLPVCRI